jgi:hypothetical protein
MPLIADCQLAIADCRLSDKKLQTVKNETSDPISNWQSPIGDTPNRQ